MAKINFICPKCRQPLEASDELVGQSLSCPSCNKPIEIPHLTKPVISTATIQPVPPLTGKLLPHNVSNSNRSSLPSSTSSRPNAPSALRWILIGVTSLGVFFIGVLGAYLVLRNPYPAGSVINIWADQPPVDFAVYITDFTLKVLSNEEISTLQWQCTVRNHMNVPARIQLKLNFLDSTGFSCAQATYDSNSGHGDITSEAIVTGTTRIARSLIRKLYKCHVESTLLDTDASIDKRKKEREDELLRRTEESERLAKASRDLARDQAERVERALKEQAAEDEKRIAIGRAKWRRLEVGMSQAEVRSILGEPPMTQGVMNSISWIYEPLARGRRGGVVTFENHKLDVWISPQ